MDKTSYLIPGAKVAQVPLQRAAAASSGPGRDNAEVAEMRTRLRDMRGLLHKALAEVAPGRDFSHIIRARGMFSFLGVTEQQVEALKKDHAVYMVGSSRINIAGITAANVDHLARAVAAVL